MKINFNTILILIAGVIALTGGLILQNSKAFFTQTKAKTPLLEFSLPDDSDKLRRISEWQGSILIINFWATWCPPCLKEIPEFIKLQKEFDEKGVQFIGIAVEDKQAVKDYLKSININYPILIGGEQAIVLSHKLGNIVNAVPFTLIIDQQGQIVHRQPGELSRKKIKEIIEPLILNPPQKNTERTVNKNISKIPSLDN